MSTFTRLRKTPEGLYQAQIFDNEGHLTPWTLAIKFTELKKWLKRKNLTAPNLKDLDFSAPDATVIIENEGRIWGKPTHKDSQYNY